MVTSVNTNINAMAAIASLNAISTQMTDTQGAIESGLKVGSAADNPAVFTIAQGLRANVQALQAVSDSLSTGVATIQGQTAGATSISNTLSTLLQTVTQAQNQTGAALTASNSTITAALANIDAYAKASTINGVNLLSSAGSVNILSNVNGTNTVATTANASTSAGLGLSGLAVSSAATQISANSIMTPGANFTAGETVSFQPTGGGSAQNFTFTASLTPAVGQVSIGANTAASLTSLVNAMSQAGITGVTASATALTSTTGGLSDSLANGVMTGGPAAADKIVFTPTGGAATTFTWGAAAGDVAVGTTSLQSMQNMAAAMSTAGVAASVDSSGQLTVAGGTSVATIAATQTTTTVPSGQASIALVNNAIAKIGATLSSLGSATTTLQGLSSFTASLSTSVTTSLGAMVDANLSQESAMLSSLQTKQSLAIQSLSLANQGPGALLQLFR